MDMQLFSTVFATLFLAEMGDKTQLAVITLTASSRKPLTVFLAAAAALAAVTGLGVLFGQGAAKMLPDGLLNRVAASAFIAIGIWMWAHPA